MDRPSRIPSKCNVSYVDTLPNRQAGSKADTYNREHTRVDGSFMLAMAIMSSRTGRRSRVSALYLYVPVKPNEEQSNAV